MLAQKFSGSNLMSINEVSNDIIQNHDLIILASRTYMGRISAQGWLEEHWGVLQSKQVYLLVVGMVPADAPASTSSFELIPSSIRAALVGYRKLPGRIKYHKLNLFEKMVLKMVAGGKKGDEDRVDPKHIASVIADIERLSRV